MVSRGGGGRRPSPRYAGRVPQGLGPGGLGAPGRGGWRGVSLCSRRPGGERIGGGGDLGRCWAGAKVGPEELLRGQAGRWELPVKDGRGARGPRSGGTSSVRRGARRRGELLPRPRERAAW